MLYHMVDLPQDLAVVFFRIVSFLKIALRHTVGQLHTALIDYAVPLFLHLQKYRIFRFRSPIRADTQFLLVGRFFHRRTDQIGAVRIKIHVADRVIAVLVRLYALFDPRKQFRTLRFRQQIFFFYAFKYA